MKACKITEYLFLYSNLGRDSWLYIKPQSPHSPHPITRSTKSSKPRLHIPQTHQLSNLHNQSPVSNLNLPKKKNPPQLVLHAKNKNPALCRSPIWSSGKLSVNLEEYDVFVRLVLWGFSFARVVAKRGQDFVFRTR